MQSWIDDRKNQKKYDSIKNRKIITNLVKYENLNSTNNRYKNKKENSRW